MDAFSAARRLRWWAGRLGDGRGAVSARFATKVTLLHRREHFRASKIMLERAMAHPNIELRTNTVVEEVLGVEEKEVKGLRMKDVKTGAGRTAREGAVSGHRHKPNTKMFAGRWIWTRTATSRPRATC